MEEMAMTNYFGGVYKSKRVLITGHTGFKGSWLAYWLLKMGSDVFGLALKPLTSPNHFDLLGLESKMTSIIQDINDFDGTLNQINQINPDIIFHLAAQPLVRESYYDPIGTLSTNIMGTANILEISRSLKNLKAIVIVTSDKCYENKEWIWGYREVDAMGGKDPYSASKGAAELVVSSFRHSFYNSIKIPLASVRAGNVIGGGDWAKDRIMSDIIKSATNGSELSLRYPNATRPWQFVLEPLSGYLLLAERMISGIGEYSEAWNLGPDTDSNRSVLELVIAAKNSWNKIEYKIDTNKNPHEARFLMLDSTKARTLLGWRPVWGFEKTVMHTINWYKAYYQKNQLMTDSILLEYVKEARDSGLDWALFR